MIQFYLASGFLLFLVVALEEKPYFWKESDEWPSCSVTCGDGIMIKEIFCTKLVNNTFVKIPKEKCFFISEPKMNAMPCRNPKCPVIHAWKTYPWSSCSHSCGNLGFQTRDVDCCEKSYDSKDLVVDEESCEGVPKPMSRSECNRMDCKPAFEAGKWRKCIEGPECKPGKQIRKLKCSKLLMDGTIRPIAISQCYKRNIPIPQKWRKCFDFMNSEECLKKGPPRKVKFNTINNNLYQMRHTKVVNVQIGQIGYLLPYSRVIVTCSIENFPLHEIAWSHRNITFRYKRKTSNRIRVDKTGKLRIKKLIFEDQGEWKCLADLSYKSAIIKIRNPSSGFRDWAIRSNLWKMGMLAEESLGSRNIQEVVHWVKSEWSVCSVTCSGDGSQYRDVQCEKVKLKTYEVLDDSQCERVLKSYPAKVRTCHNSVKCPEWRYNSSSQSKCLNDCINIGIAKREIDLKCFYLQEEVPLHLCDVNSKPYEQCKNDICQLDWRLSSWSKCSKSCGGVGIQGRHIACVWKHSRKSARSLCHDNKFPNPKVVRSCLTKACLMGCIDLSSMCIGNSRTCNQGLYRYLCCLTCQKYFMTLSKDKN